MYINYLYIITLLFTATSIYGAPVFSTPKTTEIGNTIKETLSEYYENIIDQVMLDVSEDTLSYIPQSISHDNVEARHSIIKSMDRHLNFMRASLLASVNPLVSLDIHQITELQINTEEAKEISDQLISALPRLNEKISHQLGLIINAKQSSVILIHQATSLLHKSSNDKTASTITVEWSLRQPFQINVVRENQYEEEMDATTEYQWLLKRLSQVEVDLLNEFNDHIQDASQLVFERFNS